MVSALSPIVVEFDTLTVVAGASMLGDRASTTITSGFKIEEFVTALLLDIEVVAGASISGVGTSTTITAGFKIEEFVTELLLDVEVVALSMVKMAVEDAEWLRDVGADRLPCLSVWLDDRRNGDDTYSINDFIILKDCTVY